MDNKLKKYHTRIHHKNITQYVLFLSTVFLLLSFISFEKKITIWMIGDSTMAIKETKAFPETGWGMPFVYFFDSSIHIENKAKNGRSTKTCILENIWQSVEEKMQEGDYLFIQFGHNDEVKTKASYTPPQEYVENIQKFIHTAKSKKVIPILFTPLSRRNFDSMGNIMQTHPEYSPLVRKIAKEENVLLIDTDELSRTLYQQWGDEKSKLLFLYLDSLEHPNYPNGKKDNTHFNELGARKIAQLVLNEIKKNIPALATHIIHFSPKP